MSGDARLEQARTRLRAGDLDGAARTCSAVHETDPAYAGARHLLGFVALQRGDAHAAADAFGAAIRAGGDAPDLHLNLGFALLDEGRSAEAVSAFERAVAGAPRWVPALNGLGVALQECGRLEAAGRAFERARAEDPENLDALINLGALRTRLGQPDAALEVLRIAVAVAPDDAEAQRRLGDARAAGSSWREAAASYDRACSLAPRDGAACRGLGAALERLGDGQGAAAAYRRAIEIDPQDVDALAALGVLLREVGQLEAAIDCLRRAAALRPDDESLGRALRGASSGQLAGWHWPMIADEARNDAYREAIERAVTHDSVVLDIGTGSGLLAMMAARAGARRVYACEANPALAEAAREVVALNGLADRITVVEGMSTTLRVGEELAEPATVLVSEIVDVGLLAEGVLPTVRHAAGHLLAPDATVIPASANVYARLVEMPRLRAVNPVRRISGFDLSPLDRLRDPDAYLDLHLAQHLHRALSEDVEIARVDLARPGPPAPQLRTVEITPIRSGAVDAVAVWFALHLDARTTIETRPGGPITAWGQAVHFQDADLVARAGHALRLEARLSDTRIEVTALPDPA